MLNVNIYSWNTLSNDDKKKIMDRAEEDISSVLEAVSDIIENVRKKGDSAVAEYNARFDRTPPGMSLPVSEEEFREAEAPSGIVELGRGDSQIQQEAINPTEDAATSPPRGCARSIRRGRR